ncbi:MAG TPA: sigma 54-interacting transcriptional regulator [Vicinamibacterales bacterium]
MRLDAQQSRIVPVDRHARADAASSFVGESETFRAVRATIEQIAPTTVTVLLLGETGTGKGLAAREIHRRGSRAHAPFVTVDCTALPVSLVESELFGRERGAFTDARATQVGRLELANGGTLFLDEIADLPLDAQGKLLRVLQQGEFERLGSPRTIRVDVRVIAATSRDLVTDVRDGRFRRDLYYRLNVFPVAMPALRERPADIPILARHLVDRFARKHQRRIDEIPPSLFDTLATYHWSGNIRELENVLERAVITSGPVLRLPAPLQADPADATGPPFTRLADIERAHIVRMLDRTGWRIEGPRGAARALDLKPSTLRSRMRKLGIRRRTPAPVGV